ncbi:MAG: DUF3810 domain-containing protein [Flavobacteriaceae bacterium]
MAFFPEFVEKYYSNGLYHYLSAYSRKMFGVVPFSVGDVMYGVVILWLLWLIFRIKKSFTWKRAVVGLANGFSVFYFLFHLFWGMNYYRVPLTEKMNLTYDYTYQDLTDFTDKLIAEANALHFQMTGNDSLRVDNPYSNTEIFEKSLNGYHNLAEHYPDFAYSTLCVKNSLLSTPLSYMGFGGYMNPFSGEAQVNALLPKYTFPTTTLHEMAHQIGYASESEANFIGYLASVYNEDKYFKYSGTIFALRYCLRNIERMTPDKLEAYLSKINHGIRLNFEQSREFWDSYQTPVEAVFEVFYHNFLKVNAQEEGLETYSKFIGLLISFQT